MTLHCTKTGRHWPAASYGMARQMALLMGLKDWEWCPAGTMPATISERASHG